MESQAALLTYLCILNVPLLLSQQLKELECPCSFFAQSNYKMVPVGNDEKPIPYNTCLTTVPTAAGENITELRGLNASCKRMKSSPAVIPYEVFDQIFKDKDIHSFPELADWPIQTVFLVDNSVPGTHFARDDPYGCTFLYYVDDDLNLYNKDFPENDGWFDSCQALLEHKYFEMVLCETKPWVDQAANCSCPCGFALDHGGICVGGIPSCDPIINYTLISVLCYGVNNTVGYPARFYNNSPDANVSHLWPNDTVFFFGDPIHVVDDGSGQAQQPASPMCGFKSSLNDGAVIVKNCDELLNYTDIFGVLCFGYMGQFYGECPRLRLRCAADNLISLGWIAALLIFVSIVIGKQF